MRTQNKTKSRYIIRKYVIATSMKEALRKSKDTPVEEVFIDNDWKEPPLQNKLGYK